MYHINFRLSILQFRIVLWFLAFSAGGVDGSVKHVCANKNLECLWKKQVSELLANKMHLNIQLWPQAGTPQKEVLCLRMYIYI